MSILIIGDIMVDVNYFSKIERNAPEANIPIHNIQDTTYILGGASNVANNLTQMGVDVELISVTGNDYYGEIIKTLLNSKKIKHNLFTDDSRKTTQKNRIIDNNNIVVRYDIEDTNDINSTLQDKILNYVKEKKKNIHSIIISDYDKGVVTYQLCQNIINYCNENNIYTFVDPKLKNYSKYTNCFCFKPNLSEAQVLSKSNDLKYIFEFIKKNIHSKNTLITCGEDGIYVNNINTHITKNKNIKVVDVTGAGDVVISVLVYCFKTYKDIILSSKIANYIAGVSVEVVGNYTVNISDIEYCYKKLTSSSNTGDEKETSLIKVNSKVIYDNEVDKLTEFQNKNVVFTNGCFDIIHSAHLKLLNFSKQQGDVLVVGLNSDDSIKRIKGETRPINDINERSELLLNLNNIVDYVVVFNEDTPYNILKHIQPNVIVKGGDYKKEDVIGGEFANEILLFDYINNKSTTLTIKKINNYVK